MSYVPQEQLEGKSLIVHYIIECRGRGHFLPYDEHRLINKWLAAANNDADALLLVLSEVIPLFFQKASEKSQPPSLLRIDKKVNKILEARRHRSMSCS